MSTATVWWVNTERFRETPEALGLLTAEERAQHQRFIPPGKRDEYLVARVLAKTVLGNALGCAPKEVRFTANEWGRPELTPRSPLRFNITHTEGLVAMIVSIEHEVGCDTELIARAPRLITLGPDVFAPKELAELNALPADQREGRAVTLWTLKESYIKARGMGLALALDGFAFRFSEQGTRLEVEPALNDDGSLWQFETTTLGPHLLSTAIHAPPAQRIAVEFREAHLK